MAPPHAVQSTTKGATADEKGANGNANGKKNGSATRDVTGAGVESGRRLSRGAKISRRVRACQQCQSRKIKCDLPEGQEPCVRCAGLGLNCVVNKSLQTLLDDENEWKTGVESQLKALQAALTDVQSVLRSGHPSHVPTPGSGHHAPPYHHPTTGSIASSGTHERPSPAHPPPTITAMTRENSPDPVEARPTEEQPIGGAPAASLFEVTKLRNIRNDPGSHARAHSDCSPRDRQPDFIDSGRVSIAEAEELFATFKSTLNAYLWGGVGLRHDTLLSVRDSSSLLTASILAVTALHRKDQGQSFDQCYPVFLELVGGCMFQRYHSLDDVRAMCIGAFWLSDVSWKLSGLAVRMATELNLHQSCMRVVRSADDPHAQAGPKDWHLEGARLWYFLYLCDQHFSIAYGRPPAIHEDMAITQHEAFLRLPGVTQSDYRLHSQVAIFVILSRAYVHFRPDFSKLVASDEFEAIRQFDADLGRWRRTWMSRLVPDPDIDDYPAKGVHLHYYFARLQLLAMCLGGLSPTEQQLISSERRHFIDGAIESAQSALQMIIDDADIRRAIVGMPFYLLTSITYAAIFLMRVHAEWRGAGFKIRYEDVAQVLQEMVALLEQSGAYQKHVARYIGKGIERLLVKFRERESLYQQWQQGHLPDSKQGIQMNTVQGQAQGQMQGQDASQFPSFPSLAEFQPEWNDWMLGGTDMVDQLGIGPSELYPLNMLDVLGSQMSE